MWLQASHELATKKLRVSLKSQCIKYVAILTMTRAAASLLCKWRPTKSPLSTLCLAFQCAQGWPQHHAHTQMSDWKPESRAPCVLLCKSVNSDIIQCAQRKRHNVYWHARRGADGGWCLCCYCCCSGLARLNCVGGLWVAFVLVRQK